MEDQGAPLGSAVDTISKGWEGVSRIVRLQVRIYQDRADKEGIVVQCHARKPVMKEDVSISIGSIPA